MIWIDDARALHRRMWEDYHAEGRGRRDDATAKAWELATVYLPRALDELADQDCGGLDVVDNDDDGITEVEPV